MANEVRVTVGVKDEASNTLRQIRRETEEFQRGLSLVGVGAAAGFAGLGAAAVKMAADFQSSIGQVGAIANATKEQMGGLAETAKRIGAETAFSASAAADAMQELAANGASVTDIMGGAADAAVALAAAGGTTLPTAAKTAATAMDVWGIKAGEMTDVVNRLAGAANQSRFGVEDMAAAVASGGAAASQAGIDFGEFTTAIAATASAFSSGSDAGTSFKTFITSLPGNSEQAKAAIEDLGLAFYDAAGNLRSMPQIVQELHDKLGPLSEQQQTVALKTIFGNDAFRTAAGLMKLTGDEFQALSDKMGSTDAASIAAQRMAGLKGDVEALKGSLETLGIAAGEKALPALSGLAQGAVSAVNAVGGMSTATAELGAGFAVLVGVTPTLVGAFDKFFFSVGNGASGLAKLKAALASTQGQAALAVAGIGAVTLAIDALVTKATGHNLMEVFFGGDLEAADRAAAGVERFRKAMEDAATTATATGTKLDGVGAAMAAFKEEVRFTTDDIVSGTTVIKTYAGEMTTMSGAAQALADSHNKGSYAFERSKQVTLELVQALKAANATTLDYTRARALLAPGSDLEKIFDEAAGWRAMDEAVRKAAGGMRDIEEPLNMLEQDQEIAALQAERLASGLDGVGGAATAGAGAIAAWTQSVAAGKDGTRDLSGAIDELIGRFAATNPVVATLKAENGFLNEELDDLKSKTGELTAAEQARVDLIEKTIEKNGRLIEGYDSNQKALDAARQALTNYIGEGGLGALMTAMESAGRGHEEQIEALRALSSGYQTIQSRDIPGMITKFQELKGTLSPEEWAVIAEAVGPEFVKRLVAGFTDTGQIEAAGKLFGDKLVGGAVLGIQATAPLLDAEAEAAGALAAAGLSDPNNLNAARTAGTTIVTSAAEGVGAGEGELTAAGKAAVGMAAAGMTTSAATEGRRVGNSVTEGVAAGMLDPAFVARVEAAAKALVAKVAPFMKVKLEASSPSRLIAREVGRPIVEGIAKGMTDGAPALDAAVTASVERLVRGFSGQLPGVASAAAMSLERGGGYTFSGAGGRPSNVGGSMRPGAVGDLPNAWGGAGGVPSNVSNPRQWFRANNPAYAFAPDYVIDAILAKLPGGAPAIGNTQDGTDLGYAPGKSFNPAGGNWVTASTENATNYLRTLTWEGAQSNSMNVQQNDGSLPVSQYDQLAKLSAEFGIPILDLHHRLGQRTNALGRVPTFEEFRAWLRTLPRRNSPKYGDLQGILEAARAGGQGALGVDAAWSVINDWIDNPFVNDPSLPANGYNGAQGFQPWDGAGLGGGGISMPGWAIEAMQDPRADLRFPGAAAVGSPSPSGYTPTVVDPAGGTYSSIWGSGPGAGTEENPVHVFDRRLYEALFPGGEPATGGGSPVLEQAAAAAGAGGSGRVNVTINVQGSIYERDLGEVAKRARREMEMVFS